MIVPSIDLQNGQAVQLIGGEKKALDAGDPRPLATRFAIAGEIAVVDLDAAMGNGNNRDVIKDLLRLAPCRVGGGIRDYETAVDWLNLGATKIVLGTAATPELLSRLPRERTIVALDARDGEVVVEGWKKGTGATIEERMAALRDLTGGFLVTIVEREGRLAGIDLNQVGRLRELAGDCELTIAGGITTAGDIRALDELGCHGQVGMALYTDKLSLADAIVAPMRPNDKDALWPTVITDEHGVALGLAYSNQESVREAVKKRMGVYHSRKRGLWVKGESSGNTQELLNIALDCDRDTMRFTVRQQGEGFCHTGTRTCWGEDAGIARLARRLLDRLANAPDGSYTRKLLDNPDMLEGKLREETAELIDADTSDAVVHETADVIYFAVVKLISAGGRLEDVAREFDRRERRVTRRPGKVKEGPSHGD